MKETLTSLLLEPTLEGAFRQKSVLGCSVGVEATLRLNQWEVRSQDKVSMTEQKELFESITFDDT